MSLINATPPRTEVHKSAWRSPTAGISLVAVVVVLAALAGVAWFLFTGPLATINRGPASTTNVTVNLPAQAVQPLPPPAKPVAGTSSLSVCAPAGCHLPPMEIDNSAAMGTGYLTPVELNLEFSTPVATAEELGRMMEGLVQTGGVAVVRSDGMHLVVQYDTAVVEPARIRQRLTELGHPAIAGTEVRDTDATE